MSRADYQKMYERELNDLHAFSQRAIDHAKSAGSEASVAAMMEELRLRTHLVNAALAFVNEASEERTLVAA